MPTADGLPALTRRPFTPRSFVGMTMGARKRAARRWLWPWMQRREALHDFREMITEAPGVKVEYHLSRRRYRIGERLRPCEGCLRCRSCAGCEVLTFEGDTCEDCGRETPMATESCDGSGVLPARKS